MSASVRPVLLAALNTEPARGSARARRRSPARDAGARRPGLPAAGGRRRALRRLHRSGARLSRAPRRQAALRPSAAPHRACRRARSRALDFGEDTVALAPTMRSSSPFRPRSRRCSSRTSPRRTNFRAILNAHFKIAPPPGLPPILGIINGTTEWLFAFPERLSVTISAADRLIEAARESWRGRSGARSRRSPACGERCRPGRSSRSAGPPLPPCRRRMPSARARKRAGAICFSPATGRRRACRPPSRARSAPATGPRELVMNRR